MNIHCLNNQFLNNDFLQIKELIEKSNYLKIFHDGKKEDVDNMIFAFSLRERCDINYIEGVLDKRNIADCYNKYILKTSLI